MVFVCFHNCKSLDDLSSLSKLDTSCGDAKEFLLSRHDTSRGRVIERVEAEPGAPRVVKSKI